PYKEVLDAYNAGLQVPEDVTLCWVDDNHGYIRQLPKPAEQARSGGNGVYYHVSYWGTPADYLWIASHSPSLMSYELSRAYDQGIRTLWVVNVGDIKPAEMELEFCMDLAWDINQWTPEKAIDYNYAWAKRTFGAAYADKIAAIKKEYYHLAAGGKPEHVHMIKYSYDDMEQRINNYATLAQQVDALKSQIPAELQDAFYQLIEYPVKGAYQMNVKTFRAAQSLELAKLGQKELALKYADEANRAYNTIQTLTDKYNNDIAGGKWRGMMNCKPRNQKQFNMPATATADKISKTKAELKKDEVFILPATNYTAISPTVKTLEGVGINQASVTVWPLDMKAYDIKEIAQAPYVDYEIPVKAGRNTIEVRCLSNFPINTDYDLRVALSIEGAYTNTQSLKTIAMKDKWHDTVVQGYNDATVDYDSNEDKTIKLRVSMMDPGVVVSEIRNTVTTKQ
ncbi:MAG: glycosyl hydrolase 115 family protein, partial [Prevotella sp.]|nr:glycosyl hydrolase 115 family protein [Prevotella sp.]